MTGKMPVSEFVMRLRTQFEMQLLTGWADQAIAVEAIREFDAALQKVKAEVIDMAMLNGTAGVKEPE